MKVFDIFKEHYEEVCSRHVDEYSKYEWAADYIFNLCTYDGDMDEKIVKDILEVCEVIIDKRNYDYIRDDNNYMKYILVCQLLYRNRWLNWGTSIRGAWFEDQCHHNQKDIFKGDEWSQYDTESGTYVKSVLNKVPFSYDNLKSLIKFMEEIPDNN